MDLDLKFIDKMKNLLGNQFPSFVDSLNKPEIKGITVNFDRLPKTIFEKTANFKFEEIPLINNGYIVDNFKFAQNKLNHMGIIYSQEPSAMYPIELLDIKHGDIILDLCAAPGGKSIQILEKLGNTGLLISNEINFKRSKILYENLSRMGFYNYIITCNNPEDYSKLTCKFDKIIIDAPCGGEGMIRKSNFDETAFSSLNIETNANRQLSILNSIKNLIKNDGIIVYSTCTYDIQENEMVIARFLKENPEFEIIKTNKLDTVATRGIKIENLDTDYGYRRYPHLHKGEGQFMIAIQKKGIIEDITQKTNIPQFEEINKKELDIVMNSTKDIVDIKNFHFIKKNSIVYISPQINLNLKNLNITHIGCILGNIEKNILKLHHNFYHTFGNLFKHKIELDEEQLNKYLHGEELEIDYPNCIATITHLSVPIGGGKVVNNRLKNYYPKELRI